MAYMVQATAHFPGFQYGGIAGEHRCDISEAGIRHIVSKAKARSSRPRSPNRAFLGERGRGSMPSAKLITWGCWHGCKV